MDIDMTMLDTEFSLDFSINMEHDLAVPQPDAMEMVTHSEGRFNYTDRYMDIWFYIRLFSNPS